MCFLVGSVYFSNGQVYTFESSDSLTSDGAAQMDIQGDDAMGKREDLERMKD